MGKRARLEICLVVLFAACTLALPPIEGSADAQTSAGSGAEQTCQFPIDCAAMSYSPCCQAASCAGVLLSQTQCVEQATLEKETTTTQGTTKNMLLTTNHYHMLRAGTCPSNFRISGWGESKALPINGYSSVSSTTTTGTILNTHLICPEDLPDNATITAMAIYGYDNTSSGSIVGCLYKSPDSSSSGTSIACITSTNSSSDQTWVSSTVSESVDNTNYTYYVSTYVSPGQDTNLRIYTVEVRYTTP